MSRPFIRALSVHLLTATGAVFAMLALVEAVDENWSGMFLWLLLAFLVDGIDGPLARKVDVQTHAPHIDGSTLDLIIDFLTYVIIPVYALFQSGLLPGLWAWVALIGLTFTSGLYFAGNWMKTADKSFLGFPGCWNMVVLVLFTVTPPPAITLAVIVPLAAAMFLPLKFIHPVRTARWRPFSLPVALLWLALALLTLLSAFEVSALAQSVLIGASTYLLGAGLLQQLLDRHKVRLN